MTRPTRTDSAVRAPAGSRPAASRQFAGSLTDDGPCGDRRTATRSPVRRAGTRAADDQSLVASWDPQPAPTSHQLSTARAGTGRAGTGQPGATRLRTGQPGATPTRPGTGQHGTGQRGTGHGAGRAGGSGRLSQAISVYGWRIYALPVLVTLTVLTLLDVVDPAAGPLTADQAASVGLADPSDSALDGDGRQPLIPNPGGGAGFEAAKASAELPGGGDFTVRGAGTWRVIPGAGEPFGKDQLFTYTVEIEDGVELEGGPHGFATTVDNTLKNPKSWIGSGRYQFQRIDDSERADLRISLASQLTTREVCGFRIPYDASCWKGDERRVVINVARWVRGAVAFQGNVVQYEQYVVNHEVGHGLGFPHTPCKASGELAPVMMQQTWGVSNDYLAALGTDRVAPDGQVCEPNAWPFPTVN